MLLKLCKFSVTMLFVNLYIVYTLAGRHIPNGTLIFGLLSGMFMILDALNSGDYRYFGDIRPEMYTLIAFTAWVFVTAPLALKPSAALDASVDFLQKLIFVFVVYYICRKDKSLKFMTFLFLAIAITASIFVISMYGVVSKRLSLSENISINSLGNLMVLGVFCALYLYKGEKWYAFTALIGIISLFLFIIALTGSRKSIVASAILIVLYAVLTPKKPIAFTAKSLFSFIILLIFLYVLYTKVAPMISETALYERLFDEEISARANSSNEGRMQLYQKAWYDFKTNFFTGLGMRNFSVKHGNYTHSAYMEVLSCTGIVGAVLYFVSYFRAFGKLWNKMKDKTQEFFQLRQYRLIFCFFIAFLYVGIGIGHLYDNVSMLELGMFMAAGCGLLKNEDGVVTHQEGVIIADAG